MINNEGRSHHFKCLREMSSTDLIVVKVRVFYWYHFLFVKTYQAFETMSSYTRSRHSTNALSSRPNVRRDIIYNMGLIRLKVFQNCKSNTYIK